MEYMYGIGWRLLNVSAQMAQRLVAHDATSNQAAIVPRLHLQTGEPVQIIESTGEDTIETLRPMAHEMNVQATVAAWLGLIALLLCAHGARAAPAGNLPTYVVRRAAGPIAVDGHLDEPSWAAAPTVGRFRFPWWKSGEREPTEARLLWDEERLYVAFVATDTHVSATVAERDAPVSADDAVEVYVAPDTGLVKAYYNFEFNALGTILDRSPADGRSASWNAEGVVVAVTVDGTLNEEDDVDGSWTTEVAIPFSAFAEYAPRVPPRDGDVWRLNLYRLGGQVNPQYSVWSETGTPAPQFHVPERFGMVRFSARSVGVGLVEVPGGADAATGERE